MDVLVIGDYYVNARPRSQQCTTKIARPQVKLCLV